MTHKEKYDIYTEMMNDIPELENRIRQSLTEREYTIYTIFLAVQDEENRLYFCDIEYGNGTPEGYNRIYKNLSKEALEKFFKLKKMELKLIDRWDDIDGSQYFTIALNETEYVDVKKCLDDYEDDWFTYIMDCENGKEVYIENEEGSGSEIGVRFISEEEQLAVLDFVAEQCQVEEELSARFEEGRDKL